MNHSASFCRRYKNIDSVRRLESRLASAVESPLCFGLPSPRCFKDGSVLVCTLARTRQINISASLMNLISNTFTANNQRPDDVLATYNEVATMVI